MQIGRTSFTDCTNKRDVTGTRSRSIFVIHQIPGASAIHEALVQKSHCQKILRLFVSPVHSAISEPHVGIISVNPVSFRPEGHASAGKRFVRIEVSPLLVEVSTRSTIDRSREGTSAERLRRQNRKERDPIRWQLPKKENL